MLKSHNNKPSLLQEWFKNEPVAVVVLRTVRARVQANQAALEMIDPKDMTKLARLQGEIQALKWLEGQEMAKVVEDAFARKEEE